MYYDITRVLTYNAYFNFLIGERGVGKTYSSKKFVINKFIKPLIVSQNASHAGSILMIYTRLDATTIAHCELRIAH